jgi:hypothetical protein
MKSKKQKDLTSRSKKAHLVHKETTEEKITPTMKRRENKLTDGRRFGKKWFREH